MEWDGFGVEVWMVCEGVGGVVRVVGGDWGYVELCGGARGGGVSEMGGADGRVSAWWEAGRRKELGVGWFSGWCAW